MFKTKEPETFELVNIDPVDMSLFIREIEAYFRIHFYKEELLKVFKFGDLCDLIVNKLEEKESNDCTTQQAFYRIRKALSEAQLFDKNKLSPDTHLEEIFPLKQRRQLIEKFESQLGLRMELLAAGKGWPLFLGRLTLLVSLVTLSCSLLAGLLLMVAACAAILLAKLPGNKFGIKTVRELAEKMALAHYNMIRRSPNVVNQQAIVIKVKELFKKEFGLEDDALTGDAPF